MAPHDYLTMQITGLNMKQRENQTPPQQERTFWFKLKLVSIRFQINSRQLPLNQSQRQKRRSSERAKKW